MNEDGPTVWVRAISQEDDSDEVKQARAAEAIAAYVRDHGEPPGGVGVMHRIIVTPKAR